MKKLWTAICWLRRVMQDAKERCILKKKDAEYYSNIAWILVKSRCNLLILIKRWGKPYLERERRQVRSSLTMISCVKETLER